ncbi:MAG: nickel-dependent lactate racemase [Promethearchaeota archaeon]
MSGTRILLPYGSGKVDVTIPEGVEVVQVDPKSPETLSDPEGAILEALNNPVEGPKFDDLFDVAVDQKVCIVTDDYTRKFPRELVIPVITKRLEDLGVKKENVFFLMACGTHKKPDPERIKATFGDLLDGYELRLSENEGSRYRDLGTTSRGTPVQVNEDYLDADVRILLTDVEYHYYAGFGGERKSILPGVSSGGSIEHNHGMLVDPAAKTGNLDGNPIHLDMEEAAQMAPPDFVVNVVMSLDRKLVAVRCGTLGKAFLEAAKIVDDSFGVELDEKFDLAIVSSGGFPKDINLYQALKAVEQTRAAINPGGSLIFLAECRDGIGHAVFEDWMKKYPTYKQVHDAVCSHFKMGGHKVYYLLKAREVQRLDIHILTELPREEVETTYQMKFVDDLQATVDRLLKPGQKILVVPHGGALLLKADLEEEVAASDVE